MIKQVVEVDPAFLSQLDTRLKNIEQGLENFKVIPRREYLTRKEFMAEVSISHWKFQEMIADGTLQYKKIGRKVYVPETEVSRYFAGEIKTT